MHDWTRVNDGVFYHFHYSWVLEIKRALRRGLLPPGYYVMAEQIWGDVGNPDVLTLQSREDEDNRRGPLTGTATLTESPPKVHVRTQISRNHHTRTQRTLVIRHVSNDRIVALIEVLSAGNKSSTNGLRAMLDKVISALDGGVHVLLVDVHPPGPRDPQGIHGALISEITNNTYSLPENRPMTAVSYIGGGSIFDAFLGHSTVGEPIPDMPLFLTNENYIPVPLEQTYQAAWEDVPPRYQAILTAPKRQV